MEISNKTSIKFDPYTDLDNNEKLGRISLEIGTDTYYIENSNTLLNRRPSFFTKASIDKKTRYMNESEFNLVKKILENTDMSKVRVIQGDKDDIITVDVEKKYNDIVKSLPKMYNEFLGIVSNNSLISAKTANYSRV